MGTPFGGPVFSPPHQGARFQQREVRVHWAERRTAGRGHLPHRAGGHEQGRLTQRSASWGGRSCRLPLGPAHPCLPWPWLSPWPPSTLCSAACLVFAESGARLVPDTSPVPRVPTGPCTPAATTPCAPVQSYELILREGTYKAVQRGPGGNLPYRIQYTGLYLTVEARSGLVVSWDRKTSVFIRLRQGYKVGVGGLQTPCGRDRSGPEGPSGC